MSTVNSFMVPVCFLISKITFKNKFKIYLLQILNKFSSIVLDRIFELRLREVPFQFKISIYVYIYYVKNWNRNIEKKAWLKSSICFINLIS